MKGIYGDYAEIRMSKDSRIIVNSTMQCYGYVKEVHDGKDENQTRGIFVESGSFFAPISIFNTYSNGTIAWVLSHNNVCPINSFGFSSLQTTLSVTGRSNFIAKAVIIASTGAGTGAEERNFTICNSDLTYPNDPCLFKFEEKDRKNFRLNLKYHNPYDYTPLANDKSVYTLCTIQGRMKLGYLYADNINLVFDTLKIDTKNYFFPLCSRFHIKITNGSEFIVANKLKLLPGSQLKVDYGGKLTVNSSLIAYKATDVAIIKEDGINSSTLNEDAKIINDGTVYLDRNGYIGGTIITNDKNGRACVDLTNAFNEHRLFCESYEGRYKKRICYQLDGICASLDKNPQICHFDINKKCQSTNYNKTDDLDSQLTSKAACWSKKTGALPAYLVTISAPKQDNTVSCYDVVLTYNKSGNFDILRYCQDETVKLYVDSKPQFTLIPRGETLAKKHEATNYDSNNPPYFYSLTSPAYIDVKPAAGKIVNVTTKNKDSPTGSGSLITTMFISKVNNPSYFFPLIIFGEEMSGIIVPTNYFLKIITDETNFWGFTKQTFKYFSEGTEHAGFNDNYVLQAYQNIDIYRYGPNTKGI